MAARWSDEKIEILIETVRKYPCLYAIKSRSYRDKTQKENAWKAVEKEVDMPVEACQAKWKGLRDTFSENVRNQNLPSGSGAKKMVRWKWFESMQFVRETILHRATTTNIGTDNDELQPSKEHNPPDSDDEAEMETPQKIQQNVDTKEPSPVLKKKFKDSPIKKKSGIDRKIDLEILRMLKKNEQMENVAVQSKSVDDENVAYANYIAATLSKFDPHHKSMAKIKISQALFEVESEINLNLQQG